MLLKEKSKLNVIGGSLQNGEVKLLINALTIKIHFLRYSKEQKLN